MLNFFYTQKINSFVRSVRNNKIMIIMIAIVNLCCLFTERTLLPKLTSEQFLSTLNNNIITIKK